MIMETVAAMRRVLTGRARFVGAGHAPPDEHPQGARSERRIRADEQCPERAIQDAQRPEWPFQDNTFGAFAKRARFAGGGASRRPTADPANRRDQL
jgi:hypothetical protein